MGTQPLYSQVNHDPAYKAAVNLLGPDSWTAQRLQHADSSHLHHTSRRFFIGPIPQGWLESRRKSWYSSLRKVHDAPTFTPAHRLIATARTQSQATSTAEVNGSAVAVHDEVSSNVIPPSKNEPHNVQSETSARGTGSVGLRDVPIRPTERTQRTTSGQTYVTARTELSSSSSEEDEYHDNDYNDVDANYDQDHDDDTQDRTRGRPYNSSDLQDTARSASRSLNRTNSGRTYLNSTLDSSSVPEGATSTVSLLPYNKNATQLEPGPMSPPPPASPIHNRLSAMAGFPVNALTRSTKKVRFGSIPASSGVTGAHTLVEQATPSTEHMVHIANDQGFPQGHVVKVCKMLVRIDVTKSYERPEGDFDEKTSLSIDTRVVEKWREYMVVCRKNVNEHPCFILQLYKTRVIPAVSNSRTPKTRRRFKREIVLDRKSSKVNLFSSLDKTIVLWTPLRRRTQFVYLHPQSGNVAVEWYHFLRQILGFRRPPTIQVNIPALSVNIRLSNPFVHMTHGRDCLEDNCQHSFYEHSAAAMERLIAGRIVDRCVDVLAKNTAWKTLLDTFLFQHRLGLAWKRYDRLEWVHGAHERDMYGSMAMFKTHDLELRTKTHYPTHVEKPDAQRLEEPLPVEGFLVRLTSRVGSHRSFGGLFYKRLYFCSHNQYLLFIRPARAVPPTPSDFSGFDTSDTPSAQQIQAALPLMYDVDPYPLQSCQIRWLSDNIASDEAAHRDAAASNESSRRSRSLLACDGLIDLCDCVQVRDIQHDANSADDYIESGSDVDFDENVADTRFDDGITTELDNERTFELVLKNGLVLRLQAYNKATKQEWKKRLRMLSRYWKARQTADTELLRSIRRQNLQSLHIDTRAEAYIGSYAQKWEVSNSHASSDLYHMCGIASCRAMHTSGMLYRKPRMHALFTRCHAILAHGHLLIFRDTLRSASGKRKRQIHHDRIASIDLAQCYCYAGQITEADLLYENRTFDINAPGSQSLPRVYLGDNWTSNDQDSMTTFVLWHGNKKNWFRSMEADDEVDSVSSTRQGKRQGARLRSHFRKVSQLGVKGKSIVFKARSRVERDHWVMGISAEIEKLQQGHYGEREDGASEVRVVGDGITTIQVDR